MHLLLLKSSMTPGGIVEEMEILHEENLYLRRKACFGRREGGWMVYKNRKPFPVILDIMWKTMRAGTRAWKRCEIVDEWRFGLNERREETKAEMRLNVKSKIYHICIPKKSWFSWGTLEQHVFGLEKVTNHGERPSWKTFI